MDKKYYVLDKFAEIDTKLIGIIEAMPIKRRAVDIYGQKGNMQRAKDTYTDLENLKADLMDNVRTLRLLFSESDMMQAAEFANNMYGAVKQFNLMTPDYTKLVSALERL